MTRRRASWVAFLAGPRTSGSAAYSSKRSCMASNTLRDSSPWLRPCAPLLLGRLVQRRAQQGDLGEVVEVPGLQRGVLPVVGEAEELAGLRLEVAVALQLDERPDGQDGGGGAAVVHAQRRQLGALGALVLGVGDTAGRLEAEQEVVGESSAAGMPCALGRRSGRGHRRRPAREHRPAHRGGRAPRLGRWSPS